jgi:hypothetical protein
MIIRSKWRQDYTVVPNAVFDAGLSAEAVGVLCYLIGRSEGWKVSATALAIKFGCGRKRMHRVMAELKSAGYAHARLGGAEGGFDWIITDDPSAAPKPDDIKPDPPEIQAGPKRTENDSEMSQKGIIPKTDNPKTGQSRFGTQPNTEKKPSKEKKPSTCVRAPSGAFVKPSLDEVSAYCRERNNSVDPQRFRDYYEANGWRVGRNPMRDWKAAVRTWERNGNGNGNASGADQVGRLFG